LAEQLLGSVGTRLSHTRSVGTQAASVCSVVDGEWREALVDAAWLHDVGYAPSLVVLGFHPLDGARWLRDQGWPPEVCRLVAGHTRSLTEARLRGLGDELLGDFPSAPERAAAALAWADLTSSPKGERCSPDDRINDILARYPEGPVHEATLANRAALDGDVELIERLRCANGAR